MPQLAHKGSTVAGRYKDAVFICVVQLQTRVVSAKSREPKVGSKSRDFVTCDHQKSKKIVGGFCHFLVFGRPFLASFEPIFSFEITSHRLMSHTCQFSIHPSLIIVHAHAHTHHQDDINIILCNCTTIESHTHGHDVTVTHAVVAAAAAAATNSISLACLPPPPPPAPAADAAAAVDAAAADARPRSSSPPKMRVRSLRNQRR